MLALDLARFHADDFRAVIACEAALKFSVGSDDDSLGFDVATDSATHAASMMSWMGATAPEAFRQETRLHYAQGAPGAFVGDLFYFNVDHDLRGEADAIDTSRCAVHLLTGEYDYLTIPCSDDAAKQISGATYEVMKGLGHFPMSEDPDGFVEYLLPILDGIAAGG
jgi:pimeloyl-ACP methyl ester carboxylesterase